MRLIGDQVQKVIFFNDSSGSYLQTLAFLIVTKIRAKIPLNLSF
jgi:hypothetical protein